MSVRDDSDDYAGILISGVPLMDTRAPAEFMRGAFPGAVNLPLMTDDERAQVGTCYKQRGQAAAIKLGHSLVAGEVKERRIDAWRQFAADHPDGYLYCFRGGLRSQIVQQWLCESGVAFPRVVGGYKAMRRFLIDCLEERAASDTFWLVAGATGSGKTRLLRRLPRAIDLEALAHHRGSAFGHLLKPQPSQIDFENALAIDLIKWAQSPGPVLLEDEGRLIGRIALPETLRERMSKAPLLVLDYPIDARVDVVLHDYIVDLGERYLAQCEDPTTALETHRQRLLNDLSRTRKRLGSERYAQLHRDMDRAFATQRRNGDIDGHRGWIRRLLEEYYDPMYRYQLSRREGKQLFSGSREEVEGFVAEQLSAYAA